jgi:hypothetical protein
MRVLILLLVVSVSLIACNPAKSPDSSGTSNAIRQNDIVPQEFRHLLPMAQRWGVGDDNERSELTNKAGTADKQALQNAVNPYRQQINSWLDSYGRNPMPAEAAAFMYMLLAMEEMGIKD